MTFFYDLNKKLAGISEQPAAKQLNERSEKWIQKAVDPSHKGDLHKALHVPQGEKIPKAKINKATHSKDAHLRHMAQFAKNVAKEDAVEEGFVDTVKSGAQSALQAIGSTLGHGSDEDMIRDLQKKAGVPVTGKVQPQQPGQNPTTAGQPPVAEEGGMPMTAKQKSFAKLAPPEDKITFADKIAGAKKEVDEMLGDVAAEAMKNALRGGKQQVADEGNAFTGKLKATPKGGKFKMGNKEYTDNSDIDEGWDDMLKDVEKRRGQMKTGEKKKTSKGEVEKTATGIRHTRSYDAKTGETDSDDDQPTGEKRGRGRPKKTDKAPERVTAKAYKHKGGRKSMEEGADYNQAQQIYNDLADIRAVAKKAQMGGAFPQGFASRLESALWAAMTLLKNQQPADAQVRERKLSSSEKEEREDIVKGMKKNKGDFKKRYGKRGEEVMYATATKMAKERGPGNPDRKKKEKTEESGTVAGSVAPAAGGKSKGGGIVGKGIYDSLNRDLEAMIAESMNVSVNMSMDEHGEPHKNITVSAEGEAAEQLAQLLNLAGMSAQESGNTGCGCDTDPCSCEELDENQPDWPTNAETTGENDPQMTRWSGGVDGPKDTGQTVGAPFNRQDSRQGVMGENKDLGMKLYAELKSFKG